MPSSDLRLIVLGSRGSMATCGPGYSEFGCSTSCYLVQFRDQSLILDAGSGILQAPASSGETPAILVSHWHLDHLLGLCMYARLNHSETQTDLYLPASSSEAAQQCLDRLFAPPFWPLTLGEYPCRLRVRAFPRTLDHGPFHVTTTEGNHPGGCLVIKVECDGKTIVYVTDYEHEASSFARLTEFSRCADLLLYDAQYTEEEYETHRGYGHSTPEKGIELMQASGAKRLLLIHHDPKSTDDILRQREMQLTDPHVQLAHEGDVIEL